MSAQGGSLRATVPVPVKPLLGAIAGLVLLTAIGFGIAQLGQESRVGVGSTTQVSDRFVGNRGVDRSVVDASMRTPVQRLYADGEVGISDFRMNGFGRIPEQRLHSIGSGDAQSLPIVGFGHVPPQRLHPVEP
jgi:hypothetical protein